MKKYLSTSDCPYRRLATHSHAYLCKSPRASRGQKCNEDCPEKTKAVVAK